MRIKTKNDLTTYQLYLMFLGYLTEQNDNVQMKSVLIELYRRAVKAEDETFEEEQ